MSVDSTDTAPRDAGAAFILMTAWTASLVVALVDAGAATLIESGGFSWFHTLLLPAAVMFAAALVALAVLAAFTAPAVRMLGGDARVGCAAAVAAAAGFRVLWSLHLFAVGSPGVDLWAGMILTACVVVASGWHYTAARSRWNGGPASAVGSCVNHSRWLMLPPVLACLVVWLALGASGASGWLSTIALTVLAASCVWLAAAGTPPAFPPASDHAGRRCGRLRLAIGVNVILGCCTLAAPAVEWRRAIVPPFDVTSPPPAGPRTIILLVVDTLRPDYLSCYGSTNPTPNIDALIADGVRFDGAVSPAPWTVPAMSSILTGVSPDVHRAMHADSTLPPQLPTLAARLGQAGYATAAFGYNPFLAASPAFSRGIRHVRLMRLGPKTYSGYLASRAFPSLYVTPAATGRITDSALAWLHDQADRPLFLWLHYYDPHLPYEPPPEWLEGVRLDPVIGPRFGGIGGPRTGELKLSADQRQAVRELYAAEVRWVDAQIGRLVAGLRAQGRYDDAVVVFTSDHGEELWDHGGFEHGHTLHRELLHVPLAVKAPGWPGGGVAPGLVDTTAVAPTILSCAGLIDPSARAPAGDAAAAGNAGAAGPFSVAPLTPNGWAQPEDGALGGVISEGLLYFDQGVAVTTDRVKWIHLEYAGRQEWFDLASDPWERHVMDAPDEPMGHALRGLLERHRARSEALRVAYELQYEARSGVDPRAVRRLHALGYVGE